jgi:hypothetical protein
LLIRTRNLGSDKKKEYLPYHYTTTTLFSILQIALKIAHFYQNSTIYICRSSKLAQNALIYQERFAQAPH